MGILVFTSLSQAIINSVLFEVARLRKQSITVTDSIGGN